MVQSKGKKLKIYLSFMFLIMFIVVLVACTGETEENQEQSNQTVVVSEDKGDSKNNEKVVEPPKPVTLTFFEASSGRSVEWFMDLYGDTIQNKFPHVTVQFRYGQEINGEWISLPQMIISGDNDIDVIMSSPGDFIQQILDNDLQFDHNDLAKQFNYDVTRLEPAAVQSIQQLSPSGELWGLPVEAWANALMYNREIFDKFGVDYPREDMTWDEVHAVARSLSRTDGDVMYRGFVASHGHMNLSNQLSASYIDPQTNKPLFSQDNRWAIHAQQLKRLHDIPGNEVDATTVGLAHRQFTVDKIAAMYVNTAMPAFLTPGAYGFDVDMDAVSMPYFNDLPGVGSQLYPTYLSVISTSLNKESAFEVISWLTAEEAQTARARKGFMPVLKMNNLKDIVGKDVPSLADRNVMAFIPEQPAATSVLTKFNGMADLEFLLQMRQYLSGEIDLNTMLRQSDEIVENKIKELMAAE